MTEDTQLVSDRVTGLLLLATTVVAAMAIQTLLGWDMFARTPTALGKAILALVGGYVVAATLLLGINQFAVRVWRQYQRLS